jgi:hypothetical protein
VRNRQAAVQQLHGRGVLLHRHVLLARLIQLRAVAAEAAHIRHCCCCCCCWWWWCVLGLRGHRNVHACLQVHTTELLLRC